MHKVILLTLLLGGCGGNTMVRTNAVVVETKPRHWGKGYYKVEVYYKYFNGQDSLIGHSSAKGLEHSYTETFRLGDSLLIGFDPQDTSNTTILEHHSNRQPIE